MIENNKSSIEKDILLKFKNSDTKIKLAVYAGIGFLIMLSLGKLSFSIANSVRGFNDLRSAIKGD